MEHRERVCTATVGIPVHYGPDLVDPNGRVGVTGQPGDADRMFGLVSCIGDELTMQSYDLEAFLNAFRGLPNDGWWGFVSDPIPRLRVTCSVTALRGALGELGIEL
jgi:hypothetical protein